jgi:hypothetical protein
LAFAISLYGGPIERLRIKFYPASFPNSSCPPSLTTEGTVQERRHHTNDVGALPAEVVGKQVRAIPVPAAASKVDCFVFLFTAGLSFKSLLTVIHL